MDSSQRGALMLVRLIAACVMVIGLLDTGLYLTQCLAPKHPVPVKIFPIVLDSIPFVIGVAVLIKAKAIANWIADKIE
jgi:hypothetical protein